MSRFATPRPRQTKQSSVGNQLGTIGLILGGAILGGQAGAQLGAVAATQRGRQNTVANTKRRQIFSGAQIMADAGYDPHDLANMFHTIAKQGGRPRLRNGLAATPIRATGIRKSTLRLQLLQVSPNPIKITRDFSRIKERLSGMPRTIHGRDRQGYGGGKVAEDRERTIRWPAAAIRAVSNILPLARVFTAAAGSV